jgi:hypothetical protein
MGRYDWDYITIPHEMGRTLDEIIRREGRKYGMLDKNTFIRSLLGSFISNYELTGKFDISRRNAIADVVKKRGLSEEPGGDGGPKGKPQMLIA